MSQQTDETLGWPDRPRAIALVVIACIGGFIVWSFHHIEMQAFIATLAIGCFAAFLAGGLVGVRLYPSLTTMFVCVGVFEGLARGWSYYGVIGAMLGGPLGFAIACVACLLPLMLISFVMVLCGVDPFVIADPSSETQVLERPDAGSK